MISHEYEKVLWCVDAQKDFMLPGGKLYVPGAEKLLPNIGRLVDAAREGHAFLVSHGCFHAPDDPEFGSFPPHCVKGTPGAEFVAEAMTGDHHRIPNDAHSRLPEKLREKNHIILEKETLDIFESRHADELVKGFSPRAEFILFGVVTEYCVGLAARGLLKRGRKVAVVTDAIETLNREAGEKTLSELKTLGAELITTNEALVRVGAGKRERASSG